PRRRRAPHPPHPHRGIRRRPPGALMPQILSPDLVLLDADLGADKEAVIRSLAARAADTERVADGAALAAAVLEREALTPTGMGAGIAIPHCKSAAVLEPSLAFARLSPAVDFGAPDGP